MSESSQSLKEYFIQQVDRVETLRSWSSFHQITCYIFQHNQLWFRTKYCMEHFIQLCPAPIDCLKTDQADLIDLFSSLKYPASRTRYLQQTAAILYQQYSNSPPKTFEVFSQFPGLSCKTARKLLAECYDLNSGYSQTHQDRVIQRLGISFSSDPEQRLQDAYQQFSQLSKSFLDLAMVRFGQTICRAKQPKCRRCPVNSECYFNSQ